MPVPELDPTIKGHGFAGWLGQGFHHAHKPVHQVRCTAIVVAEQDGKAGLSLN